MTKRKNETQDEYRDRMREYHRAYGEKRFRADRQTLRDYKVAKGCVDCGYNKHHAGLEFDHVVERNGDRTLLISKVLAREGITRTIQHIEQFCEVVCGTCHNIRTYERQQL